MMPVEPSPDLRIAEPPIMGDTADHIAGGNDFSANCWAGDLGDRHAEFIRHGMGHGPEFSRATRKGLAPKQVDLIDGKAASGPWLGLVAGHDATRSTVIR
jgi:hypothetical protein